MRWHAMTVRPSGRGVAWGVISAVHVKEMPEVVQGTYVEIEFDAGVLNQGEEVGELYGLACVARHGSYEDNVRAPCRSSHCRSSPCSGSRCRTLLSVWYVRDEAMEITRSCVYVNGMKTVGDGWWDGVRMVEERSFMVGAW
jgi:hypothetical protein